MPIADTTAQSERLRCPACGFRVFNRRVRYCESCKAALPEAFQYTVEQEAFIQADAAQIEKMRHELAQEAERIAQTKIKRRGDGG